jgi:hypothetical protein
MHATFHEGICCDMTIPPPPHTHTPPPQALFQRLVAATVAVCMLWLWRTCRCVVRTHPSPWCLSRCTCLGWSGWWTQYETQSSSDRTTLLHPRPTFCRCSNPSPDAWGPGGGGGDRAAQQKLRRSVKCYGDLPRKRFRAVHLPLCAA